MKFKNAPIAEVVIGIQFEGIVLDYPCIYNFYQKIKDSFPVIKENLPLVSNIEKLEGPSEQRLLQGFHARKFFVNLGDSKLVQLQPDKLLFNWKRTPDEQQYPHFPAVYSEFIEIYNQLKEQCDLDNKPNQFEVTYLDHIKMSDFRREDYNPSRIINLYNIEDDLNVKHLDNKFIFPVKELNGNIHVDLRSAVMNIDQSKIISMECTCRGYSDDISMEEWFEAAHKELIKLFYNITTEEAKKVWEIVL